MRLPESRESAVWRGLPENTATHSPQQGASQGSHFLLTLWCPTGSSLFRPETSTLSIFKAGSDLQWSRVLYLLLWAHIIPFLMDGHAAHREGCHWSQLSPRSRIKFGTHFNFKFHHSFREVPIWDVLVTCSSFVEKRLLMYRNWNWSALVFRFVLLPRIALLTCHQLVISCKMIVGCDHYNLCNIYSILRRHFEWLLFLKELTMGDMIVEKLNCTSMWEML